MVYADSSHPQEICPGRPVHLGNCGHGAFGGTVAAPPYFAAFNQLLAGHPDVAIPGPDPAYQDEGDRLPVVPYVVGQPGPAGEQAVAAAGYPATAAAGPVRAAAGPGGRPEPAGQPRAPAPRSRSGRAPAGEQPRARP